MLPSALLAILWYLICLALPLLQTLHALQQSKEGERKTIWLFYWIGLAACLRLSFLADWSVRLPFYLLAIICTDLYYEVQLVCIAYLVWPGSNKLQQLLGLIGRISKRAFEKVMMYGLQKILKQMQEMRKSQQGGGADALAGGAQKPTEASDRGKDMPGSYVIMAEAGVTSQIKPSPDTVIGRLKKGDVVTVLEVVEEEEGGDKVRGLLEKPHGWISIVNTRTGKRWASRCEEGATLPGGDQLQEGLMAAASVAGCNALPLLLGSSAGSAAPVNVTPEEAWEAMALLESQLARADDRSEDANVQNASALLRQMLKVLATQGESDSNRSMLTMTQTMVPEIGKIWAHPDTREYFKGLLTSDSTAAALPAAAGAGGSSSSSSGGGGDALGSDQWVLVGGPNEAETTVVAGAVDSTESLGAGGSGSAPSAGSASASPDATAADGAAASSSSSAGSASASAAGPSSGAAAAAASSS